MDNEILFTEKQKFNQWWLWLILIGADVLFLYKVVFIPVMDNPQSAEKLITNAGFLIPVILMLLATLLIVSSRLETQIRKDGIYVRFLPFHKSFKHYAWHTLSKAYVRQYSPIWEYGGWGLRFSGNGTAYNISGNKGLQLEFTNNKKLLIGTQKPDEITEVLNKIGQLKR